MGYSGLAAGNPMQGIPPMTYRPRPPLRPMELVPPAALLRPQPGSQVPPPAHIAEAAVARAEQRLQMAVQVVQPVPAAVVAAQPVEAPVVAVPSVQAVPAEAVSLVQAGVASPVQVPTQAVHPVPAQPAHVQLHPCQPPAPAAGATPWMQMVGPKAMQILNDFVPMPLMAHPAPPRLPSWDDLFRGFVNDEDNLRTQMWERNLQDLRLFRGIEAASRYQVMMMESTSPFEAEEYRQRYLLERYRF